MNAKKISKRIVAVVLTMILAVSCFVLPSVVNAAGEITVNIHYLRDDGAYGDWDVWAWADGLDGAGYAFTDNGDANGAVATIVITESTPKMGFIIRKPDWSAKDPESDRYLDLSSVVSGTVDVYCKSGEEEFTADYSNAVQGLKIKTANATAKTTVEFTFTKDVEFEVISVDDFTIVSAGGQNISVAELEMTSGTAGVMTLGDELDYSKEYTITFRDSSMKLTLPDYFSSAEFEEAYTYTGDDLGATIVDGSTQFRVWAPTAEKVELNIYAEGNGGTPEQTVEMTKDVKGTWVLVANGNLSGKYYTYNAYFDGKTNKDIVDPYAKSVGVNGKRGMILDLDSTDPDGWDKDERHTYENLTDMEIYEVHVRDFSVSANSGIANKGKYLAFTETGTTLNNEGVIPTGVDHLVDLGITSVHILPSYDYGSVDETKLETKAQYNWGYDPVNYNAPEGSYSTDPYHGEVRVNEYKQMVKGLHDAGLGVIMDVVYNHTYNTNYCFNQLVPGYFYRPGQNTSGCGNDVASERSMVSKFIVDSVKYWAEEYHLDGFRFDLMGILDVDTMNAVRAAVDEVDPSIIIYGEGWNMGSVPTKNVKMANYTNAALTPGIAYFSDTLRDAIKGSVFDAADKGFVNGNTKNYKTINNAVQYTKKWCPSPSQIINYADCHDNLTLWDKINSSNGDDTEEDRIRQNNLAAAIVQTAQGVPFMMSGEEFLRTKTKADGTFEHNSYASPDSVNELDYSRLDTYADVYNYYKGLIAFRKAHPALRLTTAEDVDNNFVSLIDTNAEKGVVAYCINGGVNGEKAEQIVVIYNPLSTDTTVTLPEGEWDIYVNDTYASADIILDTVSGTVTVPKISAMVLVKGYTPELPIDIDVKYGIVGSMTGWGEKDDYPMVDMYDSMKAMFEMFGTAFGVDGEEINLDEIEELQKMKGLYMGTTDILQPGDYEFKVRAYNDKNWSESYGAYEEEFDRTNNSQTNIKVTLTQPSVIEVILDTTGEDSEIWPVYYVVAAENMTEEPKFVFTGKPGTESELMKELLNAGGEPADDDTSKPEQSQPEQSQPQQSQPEQSQPQQSQPEQSQTQPSQQSQTSQQTSNTTPVNTGDSSNTLAIFVIALAAAAISVFAARKSKAE